MVQAHLRRRAQIAPPIAPADHLDDDFLAAFTEGRLSENESAPVLKHLVACSFCRHITAQLVRLDSEVGEAIGPTPAVADDPGRIRKLLDDLSSRVQVRSDDEAVFAYHAPAEDFKSRDGVTNDRDASSEETSEEANSESIDKSNDYT